MAVYNIYFKKSVWKDLRGIPKEELARILQKIEGLQHNPRPKGCEKLSGDERYRIRQGSYRVIYSIHDEVLTLWVVKIGHRRNVYRP